MIKKLIAVVCLIYLAQAMPAYSADKSQSFDLDFKGGTVTEFVNAIKDLDINVLTTPEGRELKVPKFKLRNVTADDLFTFLNLTGENDGYIWQSTRSMKNPNFPSGKDIWILKTKEVTDRKNQQQDSGPQAMPIAIGNLIKDKAGLNGFSIEEITTAIEKTVEADYKARGEDGKNRITFLYHKETKLLIVSGEGRAVHLAMLTISTLNRSLKYASGREK